MSDKYIQIASFKFGLDKRREELVSQPGVLTTCVNAHVNSGGELEKRKAYVPVTQPVFPTNTFGLQDTDEGLMTFGSDAAPNGTLPTGVVYQRLLPDFLGANAFETITLAGTASANGVYTQFGIANGKPYYANAAVAPSKYMFWDSGSGKWAIRNLTAGVISEWYYSLDDVATPDLVTTWVINGGAAPLPHVVLTGTPSVAQMVEVVYSCNFLGKAFVIARFQAVSGQLMTFWFYDGELVGSSRNGLVLLDSGGAVEDPSDLSQDLADQVNAITGWLAIPNTDVNSALATFASAGSTVIESPPGVSFTPVIRDEDGNPLWDSTLGVESIRLVDSLSAGNGEVLAVAVFTISAAGGTGTCDVQAPLNVDGTGNATISGGPVPTNGISTSATAADVATAINAQSTVTGYTAFVSGSTVTVTVPIGFGAAKVPPVTGVTFLNLTVITTLTLSATATGTAGGLFTIKLSPTVINQLATTGNPTRQFSGAIAASVAHPSGSVTFLWEETDPTGTVLTSGFSGIKISNVHAATTGFTATVAKGTSVTGYFKCTATDSSAATVYAVASVTFTYN